MAQKASVVEILIDCGVRSTCAREYADVCGVNGLLDYSLWIDAALRLREQSLEDLPMPKNLGHQMTEKTTAFV